MAICTISPDVSKRNKGFSNLKSFKVYFILILVLLVSGKSWGQLGTYSAGATSATGTATNITFSSFARGSGVASTSTSGYYVSSNWDNTTRAGARTANEYHGFSVQSNNTYVGTYTSFSFTVYRTTAGPTVVGVGYSTDNGSTWVDSPDYSVTNASTDYTFTWDFIDFSTTNSVIFRIYGWSASGTGNLRTKDEILYGSVSSSASPTKLAITSISPASPTAGNTFNVTVQAQDGSSIASNVATTTGISLSNTGGGTIGGTTTGTISSGSNSVTISGVTLSSSGTGVTLTATRTSGDALTTGNSSSFNVIPADPTSVSATTSSSSAVNLAATATNGNNVVVIYNNTGTFTAPTTGSAPGSAGTTLTGSGGTIVYAGLASGLTSHSSLASNTVYYYKTFSYDSNNLYSTGVTANATTQAIATTGTIGTLTAATATTATAATSGNSITTGGSATISARGLAVGTSSSPTTLVSTTGTTGSYAQTLSNLNSQTLYYTRAYATNAGGTSYGSDVSFMTLSAAPTAQPTSISGTATGARSFSVTMSGNATFPVSGATKAGYLLLYGTAAPAMIGSPNGIAPASAFSSGTQIAVTETTLPSTPTVTGLSVSSGLLPNTTYNLLIVPYTWDGTNTSTYNYLTTSAKTTTVTTQLSQYYSKATGDLDQLSTWTDDVTLAAGSAPTDFTSANQAFNIRNNATPTIGADWIVSGSNSKIIVGDGTNATNFTIPSGNKLTGTVDVSAGATLTIANVVNYPTLGTLATTSTVAYSGSSAQTVAAATYGNLSISTTGGNATAAGAIVANTSLTVANGSVFDMGTYALTGSTLATSGTGTLKTQNTSSTPIPTAKTWSMDIEYNSPGAQTIVTGIYNNLFLSTARTGSPAITLGSGIITVGGTFTVSATGIGSYTTTGNTVDFSSSSSQTIPAINYNSITNTGGGARTFPSSGTIGIAGTFTPGAGAYTLGTSTVQFNGTDQTIPKTNTSGAWYYNLVVAGSGIARFSNSGPILASGGNLTINSGATLNMGTVATLTSATTQMTTDTGTATVTINGTLNTANSAGLMGTTSTAFHNTAFPVNNITIGTNSTINFCGSGNQTISAGSYANLTISQTRSSSTITLASGIINISSLFTYSATSVSSFSNTGNTVTYNGSGTQTIGAITYNDLIISDRSGSPAITLQSGTITVGGNFSNNITTGTPTWVNTGNTFIYSSTSSQTIIPINYLNLTISGSRGTNNVTLSNTGTIGIAGAFDVSGASFTAGNGFVVTGSTVNISGTNTIPLLTLSTGQTNHYNNLTLSNGTITAGGSLKIGGSLNLSGATFYITTGSNGYSTTVNGDVNISGGSIDFAPTGTAAGGFIYLKGNLNHSIVSNTSTKKTDAVANGGFVFNGTGTSSNPQTITTNGYLKNADFTINSGTYVKLANSLTLWGNTGISASTMTVNGSFDSSTYTVTAGGSSANFILNSGGSLITSNTGGINSSILSTYVTRTFNIGANYTFYGGAASTSSAMPATVNNLTINTSGGITVTNATAITGLLTISSGTVTLNTGTNTAGSIKIGSSNGVSGTWGSSSSAATYKNAAFASTGIVTVSTNTATGTPTLSITNSPVIYNGSAQSATFSSSGTVSSILYGGSATVPTNAGTYAVTANIAASSDGFTGGGTAISAGNFVINQANQTISFASTNSKNYGDADYAPGATSATSGVNPITYASLNTAVATIVSGQVHIVGVGSTTITASQAGSANYNPASDATQTLTVNAVIPTITTSSVGSITSISALSGVGVTTNGGATVTESGICWNTSGNPTTADSHTTSGSGVLNGLSPVTTYYVKAYATNSAGTAYGSEISFTTLATYTIGVSSNNETYGTVSSTGGTYDAGTAISLTATPTSGSYRFVNWTEGGSFVSKANPYEFTASTNKTLVANFADITIPISISTPINASTFATCETCDVNVASGGSLTIDEAKTFNKVTVAAGGKLTLANGNTLTAPVTLQSTASGTATFVDSNTADIPTAVTGTVQQYLAASINTNIPNRNWYVSIPVSTANVSALSSAASVVCWNEPTGAWAPPTESILNPLRGYISVGTTANSTISFSGTLNSGSKSISLSRTQNAYKEGFNLVGNPYPSYVSWSAATKTNLDSTIWYRTQNANGTYVFDTFNRVGTNNNEAGAVTGMIPPMQAFWVRVTASGNGSSTTGTLAFNNSMRSHESGTNRLKSPGTKNTELQILRLQVSNGINRDETIVLFNTGASNSYDSYDSPKMTNANVAIPEIYTLAGNNELVINGMNSYNPETEIPLGFRPGQAADFSIRAAELTNFDSSVRVILKDAHNTSETDITETPYTFSTTDATATTNRFSVIFRSAGTTTGTPTGNDAKHFVVTTNALQQIVVDGDMDLTNESSVLVHNSVGQKLTQQRITSTRTILVQHYLPGVYIVTILSNGKASTRKVTVY